MGSEDVAPKVARHMFGGSSPARNVADSQPFKEQEDDTLLCCPDMELPQNMKDDLDALPGTSRRCKLYSLLCLSCFLIAGIAVGVILLESITKKTAKGMLAKERQKWLDEGAIGLPPGFCEEHAMPVPDVTDPDWAKRAVQEMTEEEKYRLIHGVGFAGFKLLRGYYVGSVLGVPRLGIPCIKMQDGSAGFRTSDEDIVGTVTSWPSPLAVAATWDSKLVETWAAAMGKEFRIKGANMILAPAVNLHRTPFGGRNAEYLSGEDPVLGSILVKAFVKGMQKDAGVAAAVKHFALNDQESRRTSVNSVVSERVRWEKFYVPFQSAIDAGVAAVMCSYNLVDGKQACSNRDLLQRDLRDRMGYRNFVVSDWWAIRDDEAAKAGTNINMPGDDQRYSKTKLGSTLPDHRLDDMVEQVLRGMGSSGAWSDLPGDDCRVGCNCEEALYSKKATSPEHLELARNIAAQGAVLLKNEHSSGKPVLPLSLDQKVAVIGEACVLKVDVTDQEEVWTAGSYYGIGGTSRVLSPDDISILDGMRRYTENLVRSPTDLTGFARKAMQGSDVAVVCAGTTATESVDRRTLRLDQDALVGEVVRLGVELKVPVVVIALAPGAVVMPWSAEATGILMMFPSGQMTGLAAADLLFGARMPAGKLPLTIPQEESDALRPCAERNCPYQEQLFSGWLLYTSRDVAFPFGYGLSYTTFEYKPTKLLGPTEVGSVHVTIKNVGQKPGREIVQLYMRYPSSVPDIQEEPATQLRRFHRTRELQPGEAEDVVLKLSARDMSIWDKTVSDWMTVYGSFKVGVGASSRDLRLCSTFVHQKDVSEAEVSLEPCRWSDVLSS